LYERRLAGDDPRLRTAEQLVPAEGDQIRAGGDRLADSGFAPEPRRRAGGQPLAALVDEAGAGVEDER